MLTEAVNRTASEQIVVLTMVYFSDIAHLSNIISGKRDKVLHAMEDRIDFQRDSCVR